MHPNEALIHRFYEAFAKKDADTMAACYAPDVVFNDSVFTNLVGPRAGGMWKMLTSRATDLHIVHDGVKADDSHGQAHWVATYTFTKTGRKVVNDIQARFRFRDGLIVEHTDAFDFHRWSRQALGLPGLLLGWTPFFHNKVRGEAMKGLDAYMAGR